MRQFGIRPTFAAAALAAMSACGGALNGEPLSPALAREKAAEEARKHLPFFLERLALKDASDSGFQVSILLPAEGRSRPRAELVIQDITRQGSSFHGVIARPDKNWPDFELGETMRFPASIIIDWSFSHKGRPIGLFQLRSQICSLAQTSNELAEVERQKLIEVHGVAGDILLKPKNACRPLDPRREFEAIEKARR